MHVKRRAAIGCKLPNHLPVGEILTDITQNKWKLGHTIGYGGFGDVYLGNTLFLHCLLNCVLKNIYILYIKDLYRIN